MKHALVLEGGAMRGIFTSGILDVFMEQGLTFDAAYGVSAGAAFGVNFKSGQIGRVVRYNKRFARSWRYHSFLSLLLTGNLYGTKLCYEEIPLRLDVFDLKAYKRNPMPFYAVATDADTGEAVYREIEASDPEYMAWIQASSSMPIVSRPVTIQGHRYLDGGISDPIPIRKVISEGYQKNVVILTQPKGYIKKDDLGPKTMAFLLRKYPKILERMRTRSEKYNQTLAFIEGEEKKGNLFVLRPEKALGISKTEKDLAVIDRVYQEGRSVGEQNIERLKSFLSA